MYLSTMKTLCDISYTQLSVKKLKANSCNEVSFLWKYVQGKLYLDYRKKKYKIPHL